MGGLVARWYIEHCGGAGHTRKLITLGTPYRGAAKALLPLINGVRKDLGPLAIDLSLFARSMPALHQLLPTYACIDGTVKRAV
jgi:triacylglycerol esterase/lipase EstA (alpha/beta hydrolase family)